MPSLYITNENTKIFHFSQKSRKILKKRTEEADNGLSCSEIIIEKWL